MKAAVFLLAVMALTVIPAVQPAGADNEYTLRKSRPYKQNRPGYSRLQKSDLIATRKFTDPALGPRAQGEPFDNGFFFETPTAPYGGYAPYMH